MIFGKLKRISVRYDEAGDYTEMLHRARKFEDMCRVHGDVREDRERMLMMERTSQHVFKRWKDAQVGRFIRQVIKWRPLKCE